MQTEADRELVQLPKEEPLVGEGIRASDFNPETDPGEDKIPNGVRARWPREGFVTIDEVHAECLKWPRYRVDLRSYWKAWFRQKRSHETGDWQRALHESLARIRAAIAAHHELLQEFAYLRGAQRVTEAEIEKKLLEVRAKMIHALQIKDLTIRKTITYHEADQAYISNKVRSANRMLVMREARRAERLRKLREEAMKQPGWRDESMTSLKELRKQRNPRHRGGRLTKKEAEERRLAALSQSPEPKSPSPSEPIEETKQQQLELSDATRKPSEPESKTTPS